MDAHEDYVWPRATSELILLPVTGLECVGERLLAGEVWLEERASGEAAECSHGRGMEQRDARRRRAGDWGRSGRRWDRALEVTGMRPDLRGPGDKNTDMATEALRNLQLKWKGRWGRGKVQGHAVVLEAREGEGGRCVSPSMSRAGVWSFWRRWGGEIADEDPLPPGGSGGPGVPSEEGRAWKGGGVASGVVEGVPWKRGDEDPMTRMGVTGKPG